MFSLNGIVSHQGWLPTFAAVAGAPDIKEKLLKGTAINGRTYKNCIEGTNQLDYLSGKVKESSRKPVAGARHGMAAGTSLIQVKPSCPYDRAGRPPFAARVALTSVRLQWPAPNRTPLQQPARLFKTRCGSRPG
jgi:hypothetical protein